MVHTYCLHLVIILIRYPNTIVCSLHHAGTGTNIYTHYCGHHICQWPAAGKTDNPVYTIGYSSTTRTVRPLCICGRHV
jgi:hypothetical protein